MSYKLQKNNKHLSKIFDIISENIQDSVFKKLGLRFFVYMVSKKIIHVYSVKKKKNISAIVTVIDYKNYISMNEKMINYFFQHPIQLFVNLIAVLSSMSKKSTIKIKTDYLHLLHLIIIKKNFSNISIERKDNILNNFYKKILNNHNAKVLFLCFDKKNKKAQNYYKRNNFVFLHKVKNLIYLKKDFYK